MFQLRTEKICSTFTEGEIKALRDVLRTYDEDYDPEHALLRELALDFVFALRELGIEEE